MTKLTGNVPAWTQSPFLSIFSDASARKVRGSAFTKARILKNKKYSL
jgi:hypothetical protein